MTTKISIDNIQSNTIAILGDAPRISQILVCDESYTTLDDTAVDTAGGYIKIIGSGFKTGATVTVNRQQAISVSFVSSTELRAQIPAEIAGTYVVYVVNTDGSVALRVNGITFSALPAWLTGSTLPNIDTGSAINIQLSATDASVYTLALGSSLPTGLTLSSGGLLSGSINTEIETLYNFSVVATDLQQQDSPRNFTITITIGDQLFNSVTGLLSSESNVLPFNADASINNFAVSVVGDTRPNNFGPYTPGYYSNNFDGTGDVLTVPSNAALAFGTGDFTLEMWYYTTVAPTSTNVCLYNTNGNNFFLQLRNTAFGIGQANLAENNVFSFNFVANQWYHLAVSRSGTTVRGFVNGTLISSGTNSVNYDQAGATLGGLTSSSQLITGYISNLRVVKGTAVYTTNFTPPTEPLTAITNTSLLTCQSNRFIDNSANNFAITRNGDVRIDGFGPFVPSTEFAGRGSTYFDGTGDSLTVPDNAAFDFTGDFTMEAWVYPTVIGTNNAIAAQWVTGGLAFLYKVVTNGRLQFVSFPGSSVTVTATTTTVGLNQWSHVAVTRSGTTIRLFVNGVQDATTGTVSGTLGSTTPLTIGTVGAETVQYWNGYLNNLRIVKGTALYTTAFTPPTEPLTAIANTSLLTCQTNQPANNSVFLDSSSNNFLVTRVGNTTQGSFSPYGAGWSYYFDGTGDMLTLTAGSSLVIGTNDCTIEAWIYVRGSGSEGTQNNFGTVWAKTDLNGGANDWFVETLRVDATSRTVIFNANLNQGATQVNVTTPNNSISLNTWHHVAFVKNSTTWTIYVDGVNRVSEVRQHLSTVSGYFHSVGRNANSSTLKWSFNGNISNLRVVNGTAVYTADFTPSTTPLTAITGTSLLTCANNRFVDNSTNNFTLTKNGDVSVQKFNPFGIQTAMTPVSHSAYFDGTGDELTLASSSEFNFGAGDFTVEMWVNLDVTNIQGQYFFYATGYSPNMFLWNNGAIYLRTAETSGEIVTPTASGIVAGRWHHLACVRSGNTYSIYRDGVLVVSGSSTAVTNANSQLFFGKKLKGYISNFRFVKGTAVYTDTFTPPTQPLTAIANTSLLTCQSSTFVDNSTNRFAITAAGDARPSQTNPFGFTAGTRTSYTPAAFGGSMYFDGTGDYLEMPANTIFDFRANNFTMECWVFPLTTGVITGFISNWQTGGQFNFRKSTGNRLVFIYDPVSVAAVTVTGTTTTIITGAWNHVAVVRNGSLYTLYVNGVADATTSTSAAALEVLGKPLRIGVDADATAPMNGYISDVRIVRGQALYTSNFVPPTAPLEPVTNTTLLLNGTGAAVYDASMSNNFETVGNARVSTQITKYGNTSMFFDGSGDYLIAPISQNTMFGLRDFTVEFWTNRSIGNNMRLVEFGQGLLYVDGNAKLVYYADPAARIVSDSVLATNEWVHVALVRSAGVSKLYVNGVQTGSTFTDTINYTTGAFTVGTDHGSKSQFLTGYISDLRITRAARYATNFTPPEKSYPLK